MKDKINEFIKELIKIPTSVSSKMSGPKAAKLLARYRYLEYMEAYLKKEFRALGLEAGALTYVPTEHLFTRTRIKTPAGIDIVIENEKINAFKYAVANKDAYRLPTRGILRIIHQMQTSNFKLLTSNFEKELIDRIPVRCKERDIRFVKSGSTHIFLIDYQVMLFLTYAFETGGVVVSTIDMGGFIGSFTKGVSSLCMSKQKWMPLQIRKSATTGIGNIRDPYMHIQDSHVLPDCYSFFGERQDVLRKTYTFEFIPKPCLTEDRYFIDTEYFDRLVQRHNLQLLIEFDPYIKEEVL